MTDPKDAAIKSSFPGICRAVLKIAYDNGGINRDRTEADCLRELENYLNDIWLSRHSSLNTVTIDDWLKSLSDADISTACNGEETEAAALLAKGPPDARHLLNGIFEHVC